MSNLEKMSENGKTYNDKHHPRYFLMVDISASRRDPGDHFFYASTINGKVMFTLDDEQLFQLLFQVFNSLPEEYRRKFIKAAKQWGA